MLIGGADVGVSIGLGAGIGDTDITSAIAPKMMGANDPTGKAMKFITRSGV
jgi:hypothetical protein